jgi:hypothetical protein
MDLQKELGYEDTSICRDYSYFSVKNMSLELDKKQIMSLDPEKRVNIFSLRIELTDIGEEKVKEILTYLKTITK